METNVKSVVTHYVRHHYGNLVSVEEPNFDPIEKKWVAELISDYPRIIHDDRNPEERTLKFLSLRHLGAIKVGESLAQNTITATKRDDVVETLNGLVNLWQERANRVIIKASSLNLARTTTAQTFLGKMRLIISRLEQKGIIYDYEIDNLHETEASKIRRYLRLLEGLEIVERREKGYSYGSAYAELNYEASKVHVELNTAILSYIIKNRYPALVETFGITHLEPIVHIDSLYYRPALEAGNLFGWKYESFERHCNMTYGSGSEISFRLPLILDELVASDNLRKEGSLYVGNDDLFSKMRENLDVSGYHLSKA